RIFLGELFTPSSAGTAGPAPKAYKRGAEAVFHAILGASIVAALALLGFSVDWLGCVVVAAVYSLKEIADLRNGGSWLDSTEDTGSVFFGAVMYGLPCAPLAILCLGVGIMLLHIRLGNVD
ncbi:hypothetical protein, partial [Paracoccus sp. SSK6]|uniref:hypothetical protein n=1 Tax=Paracoccus sp. SSK6 TaxID=3143131 RepID=UPI00321AE7B4